MIFCFSSLLKRHLLFAVCLVFPGLCHGSDDVPALPSVSAGWSIELISKEPDLVTPVACVFDQDGRLFVIESHTHFPPDGYQGPAEDRILVYSDSDQDGKLDQRSVFHEGGIATMGLVFLEDRSLVAVTRSEVVRLRDTDGDGKSDQRKVLARLETSANYPHNGLAGITLGPDGMLYIGQGENFGEPYELVAADGSKQIGGGEGGNIFRMSSEGGRLERVATGFWNPFGICFDPAGRLWTVGNDPDAMPPCRLLNVVESGDYGFQFRFGRAGTHPLQAWNGELPGTMPFVAGTGEAPCAVIPFRDQFLVTSWGDNRVEAYRLQHSPKGLVSQTEVIAQGGPDFRPTGIAAAADGSIYFVDWVSRSYSVHGKGRLWRLVPPESDSPKKLLGLSESERKAIDLIQAPEQDRIDEALLSENAYDKQSGIAAWLRLGLPKQISVGESKGHVVAGFLAAWRWKALCNPDAVTRKELLDLIEFGLESHSEEARLIAMRWAAESRAVELLQKIEGQLKFEPLSPQSFGAVIATISYLQNGTAARGTLDPARDEFLASIAADHQRHESIRAMALQMIPGAAKSPSCEQLRDWVGGSDSRSLRREAIQLLNERSSEDAIDALFAIAANQAVDGQSRADAIAALDLSNENVLNRIEKQFGTNANATIQSEVARVLDPSESRSVPSVDNLSEWIRQVGSGGDPDAGRRVFMRRSCIGCHRHSGRGAVTGPNLTNLKGQTRERILTSILMPSKEVGPLYVPWKILTVDGKVLLGLRTATPGVGTQLSFQDSKGEPFLVALEDIETHALSDESIMPSGLEKTMSVDELRDLLAFLTR